MRGFLKILEGLADFEDLVNSVKYKDDAVSLTGLADSSAVHIIAGLSEKLEKKSLIVVNNEVEAKRIYEDLNFFDRGNVIMFPESDLIFYDIILAHVLIKILHHSRLKIIVLYSIRKIEFFI